MLFILILCSSVILLAIFSNKFLDALGIPALLFFMCLGMLFGTDGIFKISFADFANTKDIASLALGFIIFYGGFCTKWTTAKPIIAKAAVLSTAGVFLTAVLTSVFCHFVLELSFLESFLIGAVISSTDAASVFSILKAKNLHLKENTAPLLEIESGSNDPMSYVLVILAITLMQNQSSGFVIALFFKQMIFGILIGVLVAKISIYIYEKTSIITDENGSLFIIALVLLSYLLPFFCDGNPFLAVYFLGIILGNANILNKVPMMHFFDGITKLAQIGIFFTLGLLAFPREVPSILLTGMLIFLFLTFIARPAAVFLLLSFFKSGINQCLLVSWAGLRGVASIVFAIIAMDSGITLHYDLFHLVFLISILSVAIQGTFLPLAAKMTNMIDPHVDIKKTFNDYEEECAVKLLRITVPKNHEWVGKPIRCVEFPQKSLAVLIKRKQERIIPKNSTVIQAGDNITLSLPAINLPDEL
ncbi:TPA: potassium/proton antiporter [Candidatus Gastranaerophilales bacterium HUM_15]|jgi:cell volume regulation protein cvrA|nr:MAG TPA: potassium/proton antiporter [Candidatus Gastranaerophilales bacterium HUM_8]DAA98626.1 MAG TPA: potassium/proton antiporter [Candidatus Gastranaerophilales bacterium HUM_10]DAB00936.1 MAG TPA: potassium/proton antiporter [Candidatus Gastranaerophilales bacterium HUM_11]DAB10754.1 MAG TPA: potassium/proton antiporter [Candidatus Gastranaerophilales bacterium HUM_15]DAB11930.1 MAG TPA: potassium/proton antiporter [Candidatus Gastranaerophilales bacterium HUM_16]DAB14389.1 MAG TPA: po